MTILDLRSPLLGGLIASSLLLQGCSNIALPGTTANPEANTQIANEPVAQQPARKNKKASKVAQAPAASLDAANALLQQGRKQEAANMYYRAAFGFRSPQRERVIMQAAEITASLGDSDVTNSYLERIPRSALRGENLPRYRYILALLALQEEQPNRALGLLPRSIDTLPDGLRSKVALVRERAIEMGGTSEPEVVPPIPKRIARPAAQPAAPMVSSAPRMAQAQDIPPQYQDQQQAAIQAPYQAQVQPPHQAQARPPVMRSAPQVQRPTQAVQRPAPAPRHVLPAASNRLAVLLPQSGALGAVSQEIYQGIKDTQRAYGAENVSKMYNITPANALAQYQQAVSEGADLIIGPLDKDSLAALMANPGALTTPILSLNYSSGQNNPSPALYQFGLSPEDEARQIADFSISRGQNQAIVMVPDSSWGKRLAEAFIQTYQARGGRVLIVSQYPNASTSNYLSRIQNALNNGQGANMVFLGASPTQARLIRPILQAQAGNLPVYATSHIYSGRPEKSKDTDLDGIIYTEIPMILENIGNNSLANLKYPRLYALGVDAVLISKNLSLLAQRQSLPGKTGEIRLDGNRNIQRQLSMATFANGLPRSLGN